ncbi:MAG: hypothetical protein AAF922_09565 [Pseudomonadota bacterium]
MTRWMWFMPLIGCVAGLAGLALLLGQRAANTTETEVIERIVELYIKEAGTGAARTDCAAVPAQSEGLWLIVICTRAGGQGAEYFIDRFGRVVDRHVIK